MLLGLRSSFYYEDIQAAKLWYTKVLGFPPYLDKPFYVFGIIENPHFKLPA